MHKAIRQITTIISVFLLTSGWAQSNSSSPYTLAGIGDLKHRGFVHHQLMGGISRSLQDKRKF